MSRTTQALLKLQQEQQSQQRPAEPGAAAERAAPGVEVSIEKPLDVTDPGGFKWTQEEQAAETIEEPAVIEVPPNVAEQAAPAEPTVQYVKTEENSAPFDEPSNPASEPESFNVHGTLILNSKSTGVEKPEAATADDTLEPEAEDLRPPQPPPSEESVAIDTINYGSEFRSPTPVGELAQQAEEEGDIPSPAADEPVVDEFDADVFSLEEPAEEQAEEADEVARLMQSFEQSPIDAVAGSSDWEASETSEDHPFDFEQPAEAAAAEEPVEDDESNILFDVPPSEDSDETSDDNGVRVYSRPEGKSIYHPLEELREYDDLAESAAAGQFERERQLREQLLRAGESNDDEAYLAEKAKRKAVEQPIERSAPRSEAEREDFAESVVLHRRPAAATPFDKWLDKRFDSSALMQASAELADGLRELTTSTTGNSLLLVSGQSSKQVYQPAAVAAEQIARQSSGDVLLIDANLEARMLTEKICDQQQAGLSDALQNPKKWGASCHCWRRENLFIMPVGGAAVTSYKASGRAFARLLNTLESKYEHILVDGGCVRDPFVKHLAKVCYGSIFVIKLAVTNLDEAKAGVESLNSFGARVLGCLTTNAATAE